MQDLKLQTIKYRKTGGTVPTRPRAAFVAIDLGASSGRVILGLIDSEQDATDQHIELEEVARFPNGAISVAGRLQWDILGLYRGIIAGLQAAVHICKQRGDRLTGIGIDAWAVDYGLLDKDGRLLGNPTAYRDSRTDGIPETTYEKVSAERHYEINGLQTVPFNTEFQLIAEGTGSQFPVAHSLLLIPDLLNYWLTGIKRTELTNASTTGLVDAQSRDWSTALLDGLAQHFSAYARVPELLAPIIVAGNTVGLVLPEVMAEIGIDYEVPVIAVGSHDTASAIVAIPAGSPNYAYISCGTWSLVGVELNSPVLSEASREANFSNELGVDGTVRYLRNVTGLWVLQESIATWEAQGQNVDLPELISQASGLPGFTTLIDVESSEFLAPGNMPERIAEFALRTDQPVPVTQAEVVRCIVDSLATAYGNTVTQASELSGRKVDVIHMVGGGIQNELLCQLTADVSGLPVIAGPVEGAALGNVLIQARAVGLKGAVGLDLAGLRNLGARGVELKTYLPTLGQKIAECGEDKRP